MSLDSPGGRERWKSEEPVEGDVEFVLSPARAGVIAQPPCIRGCFTSPPAAWRGRGSALLHFTRHRCCGPRDSTLFAIALARAEVG